MDNRPWVLAGPWYRWAQPGNPDSGRLSRPALQKYETVNLVNEFLKDPQKSLRFVAEDRAGTGPTAPLKLYLDLHKRFYLVVCQLHCDGPGLPTASRTEVGQAGFVVRRRVANVPPGKVGALKNVTAGLEAARAGLGLAQFAIRDQFDAVRIQAQARYYEQFQKLEELGVSLRLQGWIPSEFEKIGSWREVEERPQEVLEQTYPLYALIPDPRVQKHSGTGHSIYFGLVPTNSSDTDSLSTPRFDSDSLYEIRCFVRRKRPDGCPSEYVWSQRTATFRLAPAADLIGTSNRPVTIQLPDLPALKEQADALPFGMGAPVRLAAPKDSNLEFKMNTSTMKVTKLPFSGSICSFSIPLITIVATFVLRLFLPVVVFVFGLWFLLKLKFCIPPSVSLDAGVVADLDFALEAGISFDASLSASIEGAFVASAGIPDGSDLTELASIYSEQERGRMALDLATDFSASAGLPPASSASSLEKPLPDLTASLEWEARVEVSAS